MSEKVIRVLLDDLEDGEVEAAVTTEFSYKGSGLRKIDLTAKNSAGFDALMQKYLDNSRPASGKKVMPASKRPSGSPATHSLSSGYDSEQLTAIREWGRRNGHPNLSSRGRVPQEIIAAFEASMGSGVKPAFSAST